MKYLNVDLCLAHTVTHREYNVQYNWSRWTVYVHDKLDKRLDKRRSTPIDQASAPSQPSPPHMQAHIDIAYLSSSTCSHQRLPFVDSLTCLLGALPCLRLICTSASTGERQVPCSPQPPSLAMVAHSYLLAGDVLLSGKRCGNTGRHPRRDARSMLLTVMPRESRQGLWSEGCLTCPVGINGIEWAAGNCVGSNGSVACQAKPLALAPGVLWCFRLNEPLRSAALATDQYHHLS